MKRKVAFITGASRGIGKSCAVYLAKAGYDIAITARTLHEGEAREHSPTVKRSDMSPLPGSLDATAALCRAEGREVMVLQADITDPASLGAAAATVNAKWGGVDVLVHVARYIGAGHMDKLMDTPIEQVEKHLAGNLIATLILDKAFIPGMVERKSGVIINFTSGSAFSDPKKAAGEGGWGLCYAVSKGAIHRVAGVLAVELEGTGVQVYNVDPGFTMTERIKQDMAKFGFDLEGAPVDVSGAVVKWLVTSPDAKKFNGKTMYAQHFCHENNLLPGWTGPKHLGRMSTYDYSGAIVDGYDIELEKKFLAATAKK